MIKELGSGMLLFGMFFLTNSPMHTENIKRANNVCRDSVFAYYQYLAPGGLAGVSIVLVDNANFHYSDGTDVQQSFSFGKWKIVRDTLVLTSLLNRNDIPVTFNEQESSVSDSFHIELVKNLEGDVIANAAIFFNNDTTKICMPAFENECRFLKGSVDKIKITFNNNCSTKWYELKKSVTKLDPVVNVNFSLDNYVFLNSKKYLIRKEGLYELRTQIKKINGREKILLVKESSYYLKRKK